MRKLLMATAILALLTLLPTTPAYTDTVDLSDQKICLDPGHGGSDPGAENDDFGLQEKDINLDISYDLKALLEGDGANVIMTRTDDSYKSNNDRYTFCNEEQATTLVSVHTNSTTDPDMDGSMALCFHRDDENLAQAIYDAMCPYLKDTAPDSVEEFTSFGLDKYASGVLLKSDMPSAMMEPVFTSHPGEAEWLMQSIYGNEGEITAQCEDFECRRGQIAQAIHEGILDYFQDGESDGGDDDDGGGGGGPPCHSPPCGRDE